MEKRQVLRVVSNNIKSLLSERGISSAELAKKCKISSGTMSKMVNGNMGISISMATTLAEGLDVDIMDILKGLSKKRTKEEINKRSHSNKSEFSIGVLSINNKRITCVKDNDGNVIGTSELEGGLDLAETSGSLIQLIQEAIYAALPNNDTIKLKDAKLNLVTQSYEFEETRGKFTLFAKRYFKDVVLLSDWQITYLAAFDKKLGVSLITDKGVSLCYMNNGRLNKLGGWKFPVYDLGGENWLGHETVLHTVEASEGYVPMSKLARNVLAKFSGKIEKITETCIKSDNNADIFCSFSDLLLRSYLAKDSAAKEILERGFNLIYRAIEKVDSISKEPLKISITGSLADIYKGFFKKERLVTAPSEAARVMLLADITKEYLADSGIIN